MESINKVQYPPTDRQPTLRENLEQQLRTSTENVARIQEALSILDNNPEISRLLELLGRSYS